MKFKFLFLLIWISTCTMSQELPPVQNFSKEEYNGGNQNWMISQSDANFIYVANNKGLMEFDGSVWRVYSSPNNTIIRSVKVVKDRVYTGCYREFGYWAKAGNGTLKYTSLSENIIEKISTDEQFWNIIDHGRYVIFQSLNHLFIYDTVQEIFKIISVSNTISKVFKVDNRIFYQAFGEGMFEVVNGESKLINSDPLFRDNKVVSVFEKENYLEIHTQYEGIYKFKDGNLTRIQTELPPINLYASRQLSGGNFALGTVSNGLYITDASYKILYHIDQSEGLLNNTVLSLYEDSERNLWLGLDNGVSCINLNSSVLVYEDNKGFLGTVYSSVYHKGLLYVGTNQGLFVKPLHSKEEFRMVENTKGQVWNLTVYDDVLFCGHDLGAFIVNGFQALPILKGNNGTWKFIPTKNPSILMAGNYEGLSFFEKQNGKWTFRNKLEGFDISSRFVEFMGDEVYINHEYKGIIRLSMDADFQKVTSVYHYKSPQKGNASSIAKFDNQLFYASSEGIFKLNPKTKEFQKEESLSQIFDKGNFVSGKLISVDNSLWVFGKDNVNRISNHSLGKELHIASIPINYSYSNSITGYENLSKIGNNQYLIGTSNGYLILNPDKIQPAENPLFLNGVSVARSGATPEFRELKEEGKFANKENNIHFYFTIPSFSKMTSVEYSYRLLGSEDEDWSDWTTKSNAQFNNLGWGSYIFEVKGRIGYEEMDSVASYNFSIKRPWFLSNLALIFYLIVFVLSGFLINRLYKRYYQRQNEKIIQENKRLYEIQELENHQYIMKLKNEQLQTDIENKNRELATSTMNLINKSEILGNIQKHLEQCETKDAHIKAVMKIIHENLNGEDTWNMFAETFNNADKDFLKIIKEIHPSLTPNDLKLCAYLRLNLTSKEIASLLNISVRSVEVKRYRLRKKLNLEHEDGLIDYILSL